MKAVADEKQRLDAQGEEIRQREQKLASTLAHYDELVRKLESQKKEIITTRRPRLLFS